MTWLTNSTFKCNQRSRLNKCAQYKLILYELKKFSFFYCMLYPGYATGYFFFICLIFIWNVIDIGRRPKSQLYFVTHLASLYSFDKDKLVSYICFTNFSLFLIYLFYKKCELGKIIKSNYLIYIHSIHIVRASGMGPIH